MRERLQQQDAISKESLELESKIPSFVLPVFSNLYILYINTMIEYVAAEIAELSMNACRNFDEKVICPFHIHSAVMGDNELTQLWPYKVLKESGVRIDLI